jgi:hypothetical protein
MLLPLHPKNSSLKRAAREKMTIVIWLTAKTQSTQKFFLIKTISLRPLRLCGEIDSDQGIRQGSADNAY